MTVTNVDKDFDALALTLVAEFEASVERVWQLFADPRQLERWWGPPSWPATVEEHDLSPGGQVTYYMTGPDGQKSRGWWRVTSADPPRALEFTDGFADAEGTPNTDSKLTTVQIRLTERDAGTRMEMRSVFSSREHMDWIVDMGAVEAYQQSVGQMDAILAV